MARACAALLVFLGHIRGIFFQDFSSLDRHAKMILFGPYFLTALGHQAVIIFFVLSGYFIGANVLEAYHSERWAWYPYALRRLVRLWIVLAPALALALLWDQLGITCSGSMVYMGPRPGEHIVEFAIVTRDASPVFLANLFFLQGIVAPPFGSDAPLWSLSYEFWYYALFPLLVAVVWSTSSLKRRVTSALIVVAILAGVGRDIDLYFVIWLMGAAVAAATLFARRLPQPGRLCLVAGGTGFILVLTVARHVSSEAAGIWQDSAVGVSFSILVFLIVVRGAPASAAEEQFKRPAYQRLAARLAGCSYTLYLVHLPLIVFLRSLIAPETRWRPDPPHVLIGLTLGGLVFAYAYGVATLTEVHTDALRRWLDRKLVRVWTWLMVPKAELGAGNQPGPISPRVPGRPSNRASGPLLGVLRWTRRRN